MCARSAQSSANNNSMISHLCLSVEVAKVKDTICSKPDVYAVQQAKRYHDGRSCHQTQQSLKLFDSE